MTAGAIPWPQSPGATSTASHPAHRAELTQPPQSPGPVLLRGPSVPLLRVPWLLWGGSGEGSFILLWSNRIIYVPSFQRGNLLSFPSGVGVSGLALLGLMGTRPGPVGGPCLLSPNHQRVSNTGPPRDHPDVPWSQGQGWDHQDMLDPQPVPCAWCRAGSGPENEGGGCCCRQALPDPTRHGCRSWHKSCPWSLVPASATAGASTQGTARALPGHFRAKHGRNGAGQPLSSASLSVGRCHSKASPNPSTKAIRKINNLRTL